MRRTRPRRRSICAETHALATSVSTPFAYVLKSQEQQHADESGSRLLVTGTEALQMRIALAMQYYIANEDNTGKLLLAATLSMWRIAVCACACSSMT